MWLKILLASLFALSLLCAFVVKPAGPSAPDRNADDDAPDQVARRLRLLTWNIGNGDLESETRAHTDDLPAVAQVILDNDADAVALQELTGEAQLKLLLARLHNRYRGYVSSRGSGDRVEAVLVKSPPEPEPQKRAARTDRGEAKPQISSLRYKDSVRFNDVPAGDKFAAAATFRLREDLPEVLLVSAHADAFSASRRRTFAADIVDWTRSQTNGEAAFIAGDFNFEVSTRNRNNLFTDDAKNDSEAYAYLLKYFHDLGLEAGETAINDRRIDYIFGPAGNVSLRRAEVLRDAAVGRMDHWPLLVEVNF
jgi:endonuclease/exonuclease/phosphatase family metal-dependent hydrolase